MGTVSMTSYQDQAVWELYRKGLHQIAEEAERAWVRGKRFVPEQDAPLDRQIARLIELCNWQTRPFAEPA